MVQPSNIQNTASILVEFPHNHKMSFSVHCILLTNNNNDSTQHSYSESAPRIHLDTWRYLYRSANSAYCILLATSSFTGQT